MSAYPVSALKMIGLGLALLSLPVLTLGQAAYRQSAGAPLRLDANAQLTGRNALVPVISVTTPIHSLDLTDLSGDDYFAAGAPAFVFLKNGGGDIWYPFAALNRRPLQFTPDPDTLMIRGKVAAQNETVLTLSYDFDRLSPPAELERQMRVRYDSPLQIGLAVMPDGRAQITDIYLSGARFDQRIIPNVALRGGSKMAASKAPPT